MTTTFKLFRGDEQVDKTFFLNLYEKDDSFSLDLRNESGTVVQILLCIDKVNLEVYFCSLGPAFCEEYGIKTRENGGRLWLSVKHG